MMKVSGFNYNENNNIVFLSGTRINYFMFCLKLINLLISFAGLTQNAKIEERVALLEIQVVEIEEDVTTLGVGLTGLGENVDFLFDEQVIQDERLFTLEQATVDITAELVAVDNDIESKFFL